MIDGQRVNARLDIGEILQKERSHIRVDLIALWDRQISTGATSRFATLLAPRDFGEPAQSKTVPNKPRDPRQLTRTIGYTCDKAGYWRSHMPNPNCVCDLEIYTIQVTAMPAF